MDGFYLSQFLVSADQFTRFLNARKKTGVATEHFHLPLNTPSTVTTFAVSSGRIVFRGEWIGAKFSVRHKDPNTFAERTESRLDEMSRDPKLREAFIREMQRFLPVNTVRETVENPDYWTVLIQTVREQCRLALRHL